MENPRGYGPPPGVWQPLSAVPRQTSVQQRIEDESHLKLLATMTLVYSGLTALASVFTFLYIFLGALGVIDSDELEVSLAVAGFIVVLGFVLACVLLAKAIVLLFSGLGLLKRKWQGVTYFGAALMCLNVPLGMVLAVFTFLVLGRPSVQALYKKAPRAPVPAPAPDPKPRTDWKWPTPPMKLVRIEPPHYRVATPT